MTCKIIFINDLKSWGVHRVIRLFGNENENEYKFFKGTRHFLTRSQVNIYILILKLSLVIENILRTSREMTINQGVYPNGENS